MGLFLGIGGPPRIQEVKYLVHPRRDILYISLQSPGPDNGRHLFKGSKDLPVGIEFALEGYLNSIFLKINRGETMEGGLKVGINIIQPEVGAVKPEHLFKQGVMPEIILGNFFYVYTLPPRSAPALVFQPNPDVDALKELPVPSVVIHPESRPLFFSQDLFLIFLYRPIPKPHHCQHKEPIMISGNKYPFPGVNDLLDPAINPVTLRPAVRDIAVKHKKRVIKRSEER